MLKNSQGKKPNKTLLFGIELCSIISSWKRRSKLYQQNKYHQPSVNTAYEATISWTVQIRVEFNWQGMMIFGFADVGKKEKVYIDPNIKSLEV